MAGIQAYMSIRRHVSDTGFSVFEDIDESNEPDNEKVCVTVLLSMFPRSLWGVRNYNILHS